jgi:hypothetical protein
MLLLRLVFTSAVMVVVVWLVATGRPLVGLVLVPLLALWLLRAAESGRLTRFARRLPKPS